MELLSRILIGTAMASVLVAGQAWAEDPVPAGDDVPLLVIGGGAQVPTVEHFAGRDESFLSDLRRTLSEASLSIGAMPTGGDDAIEIEPGYSAYAQIDIAGFTIGGHVARWAATDPIGTDNKTFGVGASYNVESWTVGIDWSSGNYDEVFLDVGDGDSGDVIAFTSSYSVRPGVKINGLVEYNEDEPVQGGGVEGAFTIGIGTLINF